jgi:exosortase E/protease (VPEID-CTERM system)
MTSAVPERSDAGSRSVLARWGVAGALLLVEYLLVSFGFDAATVARRGGLWSFIGSVGAVAPLAVVAATAVLVLRGARPRSGERGPVGRPSAWLLGTHALLFAGFWGVTALVFGGDDAPGGPAALWIAVWAAVGAASAITLLVGVLGSGTVRAVVSTSLLLGLGVGVAAWIAGLLTTALWAPLTHATFALVVTLLRPWFPDVVAVPEESVIELRDFVITVAPICSGLEGVGLVTVLMLGLLVVYREELRFPHALLLLPLGVAGVWLANGARVALLLVIGATWNPDVALGGFHSKAGWVFFCAIALVLSAVARRVRFFSKAAEDAPGEEHDNPTAAYLMPALSVIATGLVTGMLASDGDPLYGLRILAAAVTVFAYRRYYADLERRFHPLSVAAGAAVGVLWLLTAEAPAAEREDPSPLWLASRIVGFVVVAPWCEELAFRGYALRRLIDADFTKVSYRATSALAILGSSLAFAAVHERWVAAFLTGIAYALVQFRTGRLMDAVVAHAASNVVIAAWVVASGQHWHL